MMAGNLKLENYSDREILHLLDDLAGADGWVDVEILAARVGLSPNGKSPEQLLIHARRCLSVRLSWIRRLTMCVERHPDKMRLHWRLTVAGQEVVKARLTKDFEAKLLGLGEFTTLPVLDAISRRYRQANPGSANLMRREWTYGTHRNRR